MVEAAAFQISGIPSQNIGGNREGQCENDGEDGAPRARGYSASYTVDTPVKAYRRLASG